LDTDALRRWLDAYGRAWETGDADLAVSLYSSDIEYYETPYDEPKRGTEGVRRYCDEAASAQRDVRFWHRPYAVLGDTAIAGWGASFIRVPSGVSVELDGIFVLKFDEHGRCRELREWWHRRETPAVTEG
jgi:hypothetical protein